jgi:hypothetical protein
VEEPLTDYYPQKDPSWDDFPLDATAKAYNQKVLRHHGKDLEDLLEEREAAPPLLNHFTFSHTLLPPNPATPLSYTMDTLPASPKDLSPASPAEAAPPGRHYILGGFSIDAMHSTFSAEDQAILDDCLYLFPDDP